MTTHTGVARGRTIELDQPLPYTDGEPLRVTVEPDSRHPSPGNARVILETMDQPPHLSREDVLELDHAIEKGKLPVRSAGAFDAGHE